jgi:hypothetical protein
MDREVSKRSDWIFEVEHGNYATVDTDAKKKHCKTVVEIG